MAELINDSFLTISGKSVAEIKIQKSKFIGQAFPIESKDEAQGIVEEVRKEYYDAVHHPYAYRLGLDKNNFRYSDDGEPSGSSGKPILEVIDKVRLTDVLVVVTRYYGGVKLGVGGLRRAYGGAAEAALGCARMEERYLYERLSIEFDYKYMNVIMRLVEEKEVKVMMNNSEERVKLDIEVRLSKEEKFRESLNNLTNGDFILKKI